MKETRFLNYAEFQTELSPNSGEQLEAWINVKQGLLTHLQAMKPSSG